MLVPLASTTVHPTVAWSNCPSFLSPKTSSAFKSISSANFVDLHPSTGGCSLRMKWRSKPPFLRSAGAVSFSVEISSNIGLVNRLWMKKTQPFWKVLPSEPVKSFNISSSCPNTKTSVKIQGFPERHIFYFLSVLWKNKAGSFNFVFLSLI